MGKNKKFVGLADEVVKDEANKIVEQELSSKRYLEEDVDVKFREDINNPSFHLSASDVYEEDGYLLSIRPSESNISSAKEKMQ